MGMNRNPDNEQKDHCFFQKKIVKRIINSQVNI